MTGYLILSKRFFVPSPYAVSLARLSPEAGLFLVSRATY